MDAGVSPGFRVDIDLAMLVIVVVFIDFAEKSAMGINKPHVCQGLSRRLKARHDVFRNIPFLNYAAFMLSYSVPIDPEPCRCIGKGCDK